MKRITTVLVLIVGLNLPFSCNNRDADCGDYDVYEIYMEDFELQTAFYNGIDFYPRDLSDQPLGFKSAAILLEVTDELRVKISEVQNAQANTWITPVMACSPALPEVINRIISMKISASDTIYSDGRSYMPNTSLNDLFYLYGYNCHSLARCDIDGIIYNVMDRAYGLYARQGEPLVFQLLSAPDTLLYTAFRFEFELDNGKAFDLSTNTLMIE